MSSCNAFDRHYGRGAVRSFAEPVVFRLGGSLDSYEWSQCLPVLKAKIERPIGNFVNEEGGLYATLPGTFLLAQWSCYSARSLTVPDPSCRIGPIRATLHISVKRGVGLDVLGLG